MAFFNVLTVNWDLWSFKISEFLKTTNKCAKIASHGINESSVLLEKILEKVLYYLSPLISSIKI